MVVVPTEVTVPFVTSHHNVKSLKRRASQRMSFLIIQGGLKPTMKLANCRQPRIALHHMTFKKHTHRAIKRLQRTIGFLSHTDARGKGRLGPHDVEVENMLNGENRSIPHQEIPPALSAGGQLGKQIVHVGRS